MLKTPFQDVMYSIQRVSRLFVLPWSWITNHRIIKSFIKTTGIHRWCLSSFKIKMSKTKSPPKSTWVFPKIGIRQNHPFKRFSIINHPFWGTPIFGNTHMFFMLLLWRNPSAPNVRRYLTKKPTPKQLAKRSSEHKGYLPPCKLVEIHPLG